MSTRSAVSIEEYLRTSFEDLDREYVDGEIVERALPDQLHSETQNNLILIVGELAKTRPLYGRPELRSRVASTRVRIPDVSIYAGPKPTEKVPTQQRPLAAIEILSPEDRHADLMQKFEEYRAWGVPHIWLVDPQKRRLHTYLNGSLHETAEFLIPEYDVRITPAEIFG